MTIRFAPSDNRNTVLRSVSWRKIRASRLKAYNDNTNTLAESVIAYDELLIHSLRHFAQHGSNSANKAREIAINASDEGDCEAFEQWHRICRMFDRRMAAKIIKE